MIFTVAQLAKRVGAELVGDGSVEISDVGAVDQADERTIAFVADQKHISKLQTSRAGAVIVGNASRIWPSRSCSLKMLTQP